MLVLSLVEHLTRGDRKPDRPGASPNHFDTNFLVAAIKGEPFRGYSQITVAGTKRRLDATRPDLALEWAAERLGPLIAKRFSGRIALVPIPGHACTSPAKVEAHRVHLLASKTADWLTRNSRGIEARAVPLLHWAKATPSAHKQGGTRDPMVVMGNYRCSLPPRFEKATVVLVDDVVTTGARICAAERFLVNNGVAVSGGAYAVARTAHKKGKAVETLTLQYDPWPPEPEAPPPF